MDEQQALQGIVAGAIEGITNSGMNVLERFKAKGLKENPGLPQLGFQSAHAAVNPNWYLKPLGKSDDGSFIAFAFMATATVQISNVSVYSSDMLEDVSFYGDTEWPGDFPFHEPAVFWVKTSIHMIGHDSQISIEWDDYEGTRRQSTYKINTSGMFMR